MSEDVYYRLGERLNENQVKLPPVDMVRRAEAVPPKDNRAFPGMGV